MPIYGVTVRGENTPRIVKADSAAKAKDHIVECKALTAVQLADAVADGVKIELAGETPPSTSDE